VIASTLDLKFQSQVERQITRHVGALLGSTRRGEQLAFTPRATGRYTLRVVDDAGMADAREVNVKRVR
jgi:membrane carboxypeptidase/penicillin-binding protein PbpC